MARPGGLSSEARAAAAAVAEAMPDAGVVVALSGGPDSAVLAWAVTECTSGSRAVTVDHALEGSPALVNAARSIAEKLSLEHTVVSASNGGSTETELRERRLAVLEAAVRPGEVIVTGHTLDDQAETVLMNILRGAGTTGLSGIPMRRPGYLRPLIGVRKDALRRVADELELPYADDPMNADPTIQRNRFRHDVIPRLETTVNSHVVPALGRLARHAAADDVVLEVRAARVPVTTSSSAIRIPAAALATLPRAVSARVARRALRLAQGPHPGSSRDVDAVLDAVDGGAATLPGGVDVGREGPWVVLVTKPPEVPAGSEILVGSSTEFGAWTFEAEQATWAIGGFDAVLPAGPRLEVRPATAGDRIAIGTGHKSVWDALSEARIPPRLRPSWPVVWSGDVVGWIPRVRVSAALGGERGVRVSTRRSG